MSLVVNSGGGGGKENIKKLTAVELKKPIDTSLLKKGDKVCIEPTITTIKKGGGIDSENCRVSERIFISTQDGGVTAIKVDVNDKTITQGTYTRLTNGSGVNGRMFSFRTSENHFITIPKGGCGIMSYCKVDPETLEIALIKTSNADDITFTTYPSSTNVVKIEENTFLLSMNVEGQVILINCDPTVETFTARNVGVESQKTMCMIPFADNKIIAMNVIGKNTLYFVMGTYSAENNSFEWGVITNTPNNLTSAGYHSNRLMAFDETTFIFFDIPSTLFTANDEGEFTVKKYNLIGMRESSWFCNDHFTLENLWDIGAHFERGYNKYVAYENKILELNPENNVISYEIKCPKAHNKPERSAFSNPGALLYDNILYYMIYYYGTRNQLYACTANTLGGYVEYSLEDIDLDDTSRAVLAVIDGKVCAIHNWNSIYFLEFKIHPSDKYWDRRFNGYYDGEKGRLI